MDKTRVVAHGMAPRPAAAITQAPPAATDAPEVLFVGRLEPRKGIDTLLGAIPHVLHAAPNTRFKIVGDDTQVGPGGKTYKEAFLAEHGRRSWIKNVTFTGRVGDAALDAAYAGCDLFVAPSRFESFGLVFVEAMRVGKAVIGCRAGGMPEVVADGVNGLLVEPGDAPALTAAILRLVQDPALRTAMGAAGRQLFDEKFTSARMAADSAGLYDLARARFEASAA